MRGTATPARTAGEISPPAKAEFLRWPEAFGSRFCLFIDTEEEFDWSRPFDRNARETTAVAALPDAHRRLRDGGAAPAYLVDHPIATARQAIDAIGPLVEAGASVGAQLHPWVNPPFQETVDHHNSYPGNLRPALEMAKLDLLSEAITTNFGRRPRIYRAGRYGIGPETLAGLAHRGYRIDSSMRARYDYRAAGGPGFARIGNRAFRRDGIVELPLTTIFTGMLRALGPALYPMLGPVPKGRGAFARARLLSRVALTPEDMPLAEATEAIRIAAGEGIRLLNFSFHSPSLVPGFTPYVRDPADLARFHGWWDGVLAELARLGYRSTNEAELIEAIDAAG
ncbi:WalW protein [Stakelama saccharophila]|uniref:WalW protein n=1 Tax=Stakelama saccharophila TaxID=3075605 RepID=A0ABZ0BCN0_9SPHN|nr:WalW protein [Stakelama sp. W311]WNO55062.1 WalW protein [Stakelama sp. W311]